MKKTQAKEMVKLLAELKQLNEECKAKNKLLKELKHRIDSYMDKNNTDAVQAGDVVVIREQCERKDLDKEAIRETYGNDFFDAFQLIKLYTRLIIK